MIRLYHTIPFLGVARAVSYFVHPLRIPDKLVVTPKAAVLTAAQHKRRKKSRGGPEFGEHRFHSLLVTTGSGMSGADSGGVATAAP